MPRPIQGATVVVTGASSGIGRAAALAFAERGASVVLVARRTELLKDLAKICEQAGGRALAVTADVTVAASVQHVADRAVETFGGIDVWINNAGVGVFGPYAEADVALHRRTVEVNLIGALHGASAALPVFKRQASGVLINTVSLGGWVPTPFAAAYTASKFGLRGFTASLRQELEAHEDIHVCGVFPAMVDTPGFVHGANMSGRTLDPGPLLYRAEDVALAMVRVALHPRGEVSVGWPARAGQVAYALAPRLTELILGAVFRRLMSHADPAPRTEGALRAPIAAGSTTDGGWLARKGTPPAGQVSTAAATAGLGLAAAVGLAIALNLRSRRASTPLR